MTQSFSIMYAAPPPRAHYSEVGGTQNLSRHSGNNEEVFSVHGMKAHGRSRRIAPLVLKLSTSMASE